MTWRLEINNIQVSRTWHLASGSGYILPDRSQMNEVAGISVNDGKSGI